MQNTDIGIMECVDHHILSLQCVQERVYFRVIVGHQLVDCLEGHL